MFKDGVRCFLVKWSHNAKSCLQVLRSQWTCLLPCWVLGSPSRLSLFLDSYIRSGSTAWSIPCCRSTHSSWSWPWPSSSCRRSGRWGSCSNSAQYGGDLSLHESPRWTVGRVIQWAALSTWAVHFSIAPSALDVHSGAGEAEPKCGKRRQIIATTIIKIPTTWSYLVLIRKSSMKM